MGVKNFNKLLKHQGCQFPTYPLNRYKGKIVIVDISLYLHKFYNSQGQLFVGLFHQIELLLRNGITPVYVFDGQYDDMKASEILKRKKLQQHHQNQAEKLKEEGDDVDKAALRLHENRSFQITPEILAWCHDFLDAFGVQYINAEGEADEYCAKLVALGKAHACLSDDTDLFAFGCPLILRNLKKPVVQECSQQQVLDCLKLHNPDQLAQVCVLLGNDYCTNIPTVGFVRSITMMQQHGSLDKIHAITKQSMEIDPDILSAQQKALAIYTNEETLDTIAAIHLDNKCTIPDVNKAIKWACDQVSPTRHARLTERIRKLSNTWSATVKNAQKDIRSMFSTK